jgi:hypothetical protein
VARALEEGRHAHGDGCGHEEETSPSVQRSTVHEVLRSPGEPLAEPLRAEMEARLGADFSDVRMHTDPAARRSAQEVDARAYTSGSHIVVGEGGADKHTLAHELTHVIQQRAGAVAGTETVGGLSISDPADRFERAAEANAAEAMSRPVPAAGHAPGAVHPSPSQDGEAVRGAPGHAPPVQRTLMCEGEKLTLEEAQKRVRDVQSAELTPSETEALRELVTDTNEHHELDSAEALVKLLRSRLRDKWGLTKEEVDLFDDYQGGAYKEWNKALRSGKVTERYKVRDAASGMIEGLAKTAKTRHRVKRTLSFETREDFTAYARQFKEGEEYTAVQFESTTRRLGATLELPEKAVYVVTLLIDAQGYHGGEISSVINTLRRSEGETVFPPGARFTVTKAPELPPEDKEFSTASPFQATCEMTELEELDESKQRMPSRDEYRAATMAALLGGSGLPRRPAPTGGSAAKKFSDLI